MRAIVTKKGGFKGKDNDSPRCLQYAEGQEIDGDIAATALREKWAEPIADEARKAPAKEAPANKAAAPSSNKGR